MLPLAGVRVLDLSTQIAGPYATKLLADAGADVVKIESPEGDPLRRWKASAILGESKPLAADEDGALFRFLNTSKRSAVLDLAIDAGREQFKGLVAGADLVVESFRPGRMAELGLGADVLRALSPRVSLVSITPFGQDGPWALRPATEFILQAAMGSTEYRGYIDRLPIGCGGRLGEYICGTYAAAGALSAFLMARCSGHGETLDVSMLECMLLSLQQYWTIHADLEPNGSAQRSVEIPSIEPAKDGWVGFCTVTGQQWQDFIAVVIGRADLAEDEYLRYALERFRQLDRVLGAIHAWTREHTIAEAVEKATLCRVPAVPVGDGRSVLRIDHFVERGTFVDNPAGFRQPRVPYRLGVGECRPFAPAPALGEHTREVLAEVSPRRVAKDAKASPQRDADTPPRPLSGIFVLDFTAFWAGPITTSYFAALGADVIKVESIQRPDGMRFAGGITPKQGQDLWEWSPVFHGVNGGKRGITLDLTRPEGLALVSRLVEAADIVVENFSPRVLDSFGLGWEGIQRLNPEAILVRMPAFGLDGPWRDRSGFAMTIEQVSGLAWVTGYPDRSPLVPRGCCDPIGGMTTVFATLAALEVRAAGGGGQLLEVPLVEVGLNVAAEQVAEWSAYGVVLERMANRGPVSAPQGVYACAGEELIALAVETDEQWRALVEALSSPQWAREPALSTAKGRREAHDAIDAALSSWLAERSAADIVEAWSSAGIPVGKLVNPREIRPHPHLDARGFFQAIDHPATGVVNYPSFPLRFSGRYQPLRTPPPTLGQHTEEVLAEKLGLTREEIEKLRSDQVIGTRPPFFS
jgi:crotonobetainyl-CoA:carnitine CoA-transferase CaiB-like acyl-CoA transferase